MYNKNSYLAYTPGRSFCAYLQFLPSKDDANTMAAADSFPNEYSKDQQERFNNARQALCNGLDLRVCHSERLLLIKS